MIRSLERGELPNEQALRGWFRMALTKKLAIISLPPAFWENDPKRNPDSRYLLWAAVLLQDIEGYRTTQSIMDAEREELNQSLSVDDRIKDGFSCLQQLVSGSPVDDQVKAGITFLLHNS